MRWVAARASAHPKGQFIPEEDRAAEKVVEMATLKRLFAAGYLVMINFREPVEGGGHYGVLQGIDDQAMEIADPYYGLRSAMPWDRLDFRTGYSEPLLHGWYAAIRGKN